MNAAHEVRDLIAPPLVPERIVRARISDIPGGDAVVAYVSLLVIRHGVSITRFESRDARLVVSDIDPVWFRVVDRRLGISHPVEV